MPLRRRKSCSRQSPATIFVGLNDYEVPGEPMYLIAHFDTIEEAEAEQRTHKDTIILYHVA